MSQQQFGVDFMDGSKKKSKESVESLKNKSKQRETEELQRQAKEALKTASSVLKDCQKLHENLKFQSKSDAEAPISRIQEKKIVELDSKLSIAYDLANQQRNEDKQYE